MYSGVYPLLSIELGSCPLARQATTRYCFPRRAVGVAANEENHTQRAYGRTRSSASALNLCVKDAS